MREGFLKHVFEPRKERGAILVFLAISIIAILFCVALAVDGYLLLTYRMQVQNDAEYAALTALRSYLEGGSGSGNDYDQEASAMANKNKVVTRASFVQTPDITLGCWDGMHFRAYTPTSCSLNEVPAAKAIIQTTSGDTSNSYRSFFAMLMGIQTLGTTGEGIAVYYDKALGAAASSAASVASSSSLSSSSSSSSSAAAVTVMPVYSIVRQRS